MNQNQEKIIVFGIGKILHDNIHLLGKEYQIIAVTDNVNQETLNGLKYIYPEDIMLYPFDKIVITTSKRFFSEIYQQLCRMGVYKDKIVDIDQAFNRCDQAKYLQDKEIYRSMYCTQKNQLCDNFQVDDRNDYPILDDWRKNAGEIGDYFWQDLWGARRIIQSRVETHFDIGSRVDGFVAHLIAGDIKVKLLDIRPLDVKIPNVSFIQTDATKLEQVESESIESLSALCSLEHFGLGRYGDPVNPNSCFEAFNAIQRVMKKGGNIYISLPVGKERLAFNAHRIFSPETIVKCFDQMQLIEYSVIDILDKEEPLKINADIHLYDNSTKTKTGLFLFQKK